MPSLFLAKQYFETRVLPRWTRDNVAEHLHEKKTGYVKIIHRRVYPDEVDRGALYPLFTNFLDSFSHFGVGIGVYFMQLIIIALMCVIAGFIMLPSALKYKADHDNNANHEITRSSNFFLSNSGACPASINVTASIDCPDSNHPCEAYYRPNCSLPQLAVISDLVMSLFLFTAVYLTSFLEKRVANALDSDVQTAQDYSLEVKDPPADADNPDEWQKFFSRFGRVRYVSVVRSNYSLIKLLLRKYELLKFVEEIQQTMFRVSLYVDAQLAASVQRLKDIDVALQSSYRGQYPVCRVYVIFDSENEKRLAMNQLEVADIDAIFNKGNNAAGVSTSNMFRGKEVLDVKEAEEPDCIVWRSLETNGYWRYALAVVANIATVGALAVLFYLISSIKAYPDERVSTYFLPVAIGCVDSALPSFFLMLTEREDPISEGERLEKQQLKLFLARLMLSIIFPYVTVSWRNFLDESTVSATINTQLTTVFLSPLINFVDMYSTGMRTLGFVFSRTQSRLNSYWTGTSWSLADRYTAIAKVLFISLFYSIVTPLSMLIAPIAFILIFFVDRYLLLRKWRQVPMLDRKVAKSLRRQMALAISLHMYVTVRFIYSWPMDSVFQTTLPDGRMGFAYADKRPSFIIWMLRPKDWMENGQRRLLTLYLIVTLAVLSITTYRWFLQNNLKRLYFLWFKERQSQSKVSETLFSQVYRILAYVPTFQLNNAEEFIIADTTGIPANNKPYVHGNCSKVGDERTVEDNDLTFLVPELYRRHVLSIVRWYPGGMFESTKSDTSAGSDLESRDMSNASNAPASADDRAVQLLHAKLSGVLKTKPDGRRRTERPARGSVNQQLVSAGDGRIQPADFSSQSPSSAGSKSLGSRSAVLGLPDTPQRRALQQFSVDTKSDFDAFEAALLRKLRADAASRPISSSRPQSNMISFPEFFTLAERPAAKLLLPSIGPARGNNKNGNDGGEDEEDAGQQPAGKVATRRKGRSVRVRSVLRKIYLNLIRKQQQQGSLGAPKGQEVEKQPHPKKLLSQLQQSDQDVLAYSLLDWDKFLKISI